jgi:hypothetical protein
VDAAGDLWVAIFGGGRVERYSPRGELRQELFLPAKETTSCAFGGRGLHWLYVTTATEEWTDDQRRAEPAAGLLYRFDTDDRPAGRAVPSGPCVVGQAGPCRRTLTRSLIATRSAPLENRTRARLKRTLRESSGSCLRDER